MPIARDVGDADDTNTNSADTGGRGGLILIVACDVGDTDDADTDTAGVSQWRAPLLTTPHMFCCVAAVTLNTSHKANLL